MFSPEHIISVRDIQKREHEVLVFEQSRASPRGILGDNFRRESCVLDKGRVKIQLGKILNDYGLNSLFGINSDARFKLRLPSAESILVA